MSAFSVVIGEARPFVREGLLRILMSTPGVVVVGTAGTPSALLCLGSSRPDAVVVGACLDREGSPALVGRLARRCPATRIIVLDCDGGLEAGDAFLRAGAACCLPVGATPAELLAALRARECADGAVGEPPPPIPPRLTAREREVAVWIVDGHTSAAIATGLGISLATVITHRTNLYRKLAVHSAGELVALMTERGLLAEPTRRGR